MIKINGRFGYVDFVNEKGEPHRLHGAAFIEDEYQSWWENGNRHHLNGPAVIHGNIIEYWIEYVKYTESEYHEKLKEMGLRYDKN